MNRMIALTRQYPLAAFFILTLVLTVPMNLIASAILEATQSIPLALPFAVLGACPLAAALIVSALVGGKAEVIALLRQLTVWRVGLRWYVVALFLLPGLHLAAIYLNVLLGAPAPATTAFGAWSAILGAFALRVVNPFGPPLIEEPGWRGFALPRMQKWHVSPLTANLILGLLVTLWHITWIPLGGYEWIYIPGTMAVTILFGWVYNSTGGSVLLTLIMHAVEPVLWINFTGADETRAMGLLVSVYVITAAVVVLLAGKNLGLKETTPAQAEIERVVTPA